MLNCTQPFSHTFFFLKKPLGSEPQRKQHLQARASANTDLDLSPWKRLWVMSKFTSCPALTNNLPPYYPSCPIQGSKGPPAPNAARPAFLTSKSVLILLQVCSSKHAKEVNRPSCSPSWNQPQESQCPSLLLQSPTRTRMLAGPLTFSFNLRWPH